MIVLFSLVVDHLLYWINCYINTRYCNLSDAPMLERLAWTVYYHIMSAFKYAHYLIGPMEVRSRAQYTYD